MTPDEFWTILHDIPLPGPIFYRLYYDGNGQPTFYAMEDLPGNYIEITKEQFAQSLRNIHVKDNKIVLNVNNFVQKLKPHQTQGACCDPCDVAVIVNCDQLHTKWSLKNNGTN